jgi:hypothetical protein
MGKKEAKVLLFSYIRIAFIGNPAKYAKDTHGI